MTQLSGEAHGMEALRQLGPAGRAERLHKMKRADLQKLAKEAGIKVAVSNLHLLNRAGACSVNGRLQDRA